MALFAFFPPGASKGLSGVKFWKPISIDLAAARNLVTNVRPRTIFNCVAYGAYSFETDFDLIYRTNFTRPRPIGGIAG